MAEESKASLSAAEFARPFNYWVTWQSSPAVLLLAINVKLMENIFEELLKTTPDLITLLL